MPEQPGNAGWQPTSYSPQYVGRLDNEDFADLIKRSEEARGNWKLLLRTVRKRWFDKMKSEYGSGAGMEDAMSSLGSNAGENAGMELRPSTYITAPGYFEPQSEEGRKAIISKLEAAAGRPLVEGKKYKPFEYWEDLGEGFKAHYDLKYDGNVVINFTRSDEMRVGGQLKKVDMPYTHPNPPKAFYTRYLTFSLSKGFHREEAPHDIGRWKKGLDSLRYYHGERNLASYYSLVDKAVGVAGMLDANTGDIWAVSGRSGVSTEDAYAAFIVEYHYGSKNPDGSRASSSGSSYLSDSLSYANDTAAKGNWMGQFTDDNFINNGDFGRSPYEMGTMANHYNRLCAENYLSLVDTLSNAGEEIPDDAVMSIDYSFLASRVNDMAQRSTLYGENASGYSPRAIERAQKSLREYRKYRLAGERIREMVGSKYDDLQTAQFVVSYCGAMDSSGNVVENYAASWPWWEPKSEMETLLKQAMSLLDANRTAEHYKGLARRNGVPVLGDTEQEPLDDRPRGGSGPAEDISLPPQSGGAYEPGSWRLGTEER